MLADRGRPRVLVVDDDDVTRLLATETLEGAGFEVYDAVDGAAAVALHAELAPDLILLDVHMPALDGYAVCRHVRARADGAATTLVVMTAADDVDSVEQAFAAGATDFLTKPLNLPLLAHRIRYLLRAARAVRDERDHARALGRVQRMARLAHWRVVAGAFTWSCDVGAVLWPEVAATVAAPRSLLALVHPDDRALVAEAMAVAAPHQLDYRMVLPDGSERLVHQDAEVVDDDGRAVVIGATQDVTDQRAAERRITQLAFFDDLTGLPSRAFLHRFLRRVLAEAEGAGAPVALLSVGIALGAVPGTVSPTDRDELRRAIAGRVIEQVRGADDDLRLDQPTGDPDSWTGGALVARPGSDELVVVLRDQRAQVPGPIAAAIAAALVAGYRIGDRELFVTSPVGIATAADSGDDPRALIEHGRAASHQARVAGRGVHHFSAEVLRAARQSAELERRLRVAVARLADERQRPEFAVHYQPKVERGSGRTHGVEALVRWFPPDGPPVSPGEFIPLAERSSAISTLGDWVLASAGPDGGVVVVHVDVDCCDAMGANLVNTLCELMAPELARRAGGVVGLRILTNLTDQRTVTVGCTIPIAALADARTDGATVAAGIAAASRFAEADRYRAATHNKGIMNGVDAVLVATGQDWRAVEAGAHAWAARAGGYAPLATWRLADDGAALIGALELPLAVGTVGGALHVHRGARAMLALAGVTTAARLAALAAAAGLACNLAALRALATDGIQRGHMALHARAVARSVGADGELIDALAAELVAGGDLRPETAAVLLAQLNGATLATSP